MNTGITNKQKWPDYRIQTRFDLLQEIANGWDELTDDRSPIVKMTFPHGFDPVAHEEDDIHRVYQEGLRRGVFPS